MWPWRWCLSLGGTWRSRTGGPLNPGSILEALPVSLGRLISAESGCFLVLLGCAFNSISLSAPPLVFFLIQESIKRKTKIAYKPTGQVSPFSFWWNKLMYTVISKFKEYRKKSRIKFSFLAPFVCILWYLIYILFLRNCI